MCMRPNTLGMLLIALGVGILAAAAIRTIWLLLLLGGLCIGGGFLCLKR